MTTANANIFRVRLTELVKNFLEESGEDVGFSASNILNFPVVAPDGEEGWVEISVKVPKGTKDEEYDGYARRIQYALACQQAADRKKSAEEAKAKKLAKKKKAE